MRPESNETPEEEIEDIEARPSSGTSMFNRPKLSDMQAVTEKLCPDIGEDLNHITAGRTFPEVYRPLQRMLVKDRLWQTRGDMGVTLTSCIARTNTVLSMSIQGEHIIDLLTLYGGVKRDEAARDGGGQLGFH